jgi:hypothetical protein
MVTKKIINPSTGRWVKRNGRIGKRLVRMKEVHTNIHKYKQVIQLWDWWAKCDDHTRERVVDSGWWDTRLNDQVNGRYPFYIMSYASVLKKAHKIVHSK